MVVAPDPTLTQGASVRGPGRAPCFKTTTFMNRHTYLLPQRKYRSRRKEETHTLFKTDEQTELLSYTKAGCRAASLSELERELERELQLAR